MGGLWDLHLGTEVCLCSSSSPSLSVLLRPLTASSHGPSYISMRGGPLPGFLLGRAPAGQNLTHACSPSYVSGQPKAPTYRTKKLRKGNTTVWRAWQFSAGYHLAASLGKRPVYLNNGNNNLREVYQEWEKYELPSSLPNPAHSAHQPDSTLATLG